MELEKPQEKSITKEKRIHCNAETQQYIESTKQTT